MTASKLLASREDRSCICIFPCPWLKRADSIIMFLFISQTWPKVVPVKLNIKTMTLGKNRALLKRVKWVAPTCSPQKLVAFSCGPSRSSAVDLGQKSGSERHFCSGGTWCWTQVFPVMVIHWCTKLSWSSHTHYTPSWTSVPSHHPHPEKT